MPDPNTETIPGDDLRAELDQAYDQVSESEPSGADPAAPASVGAAQPSSSPEGAPSDAGRARGPDGKFVKAEAAPAGAAATPAAPGAPVAAEFKIPEKWPAEVKAELAAMHAANPQHAQFVLKQYEHMRREASQVLNRAQQEAATHLKSYNDLLAPGRQQRTLQGMDDSTYVRYLIAAGDVLDKNPEQGLKALAQKYGVDLQKLANPEAGGQPEIPPYVRQTQQELAEIKKYIAQQAVGAEQHQLQAASSWIDQFATQTDQTGKPLYPHFDEVLEELIVNVQHQMQTGQTVDVKAAYDRAVRMNDSVWLKDQRARSEAEKLQAEAQRKREIEDAKRAGISVSGSGADTNAEPSASIRENLERAWGGR